MDSEITKHNNQAHESPDVESGISATSENTFVRFRGKVAFWWYAVVVLMIACTLAFIIQSVQGIISSSPDAVVSIVGAAIFVLFDVFLIDSCVRNYVDFHESSLEVRVSALSETIPYSAINLIKETNSAWASLSTSLDRILIKYRNYNDTLIAVKDKEGFLSEIQARIPQIHVERKS